jgi:hypothetical protein
VLLVGGLGCCGLASEEGWKAVCISMNVGA